MSRHYLLDGYNIIKQAPGLADLGLAQGRQGLIHWIKMSRPQGSAKNAVTIIFDGDAKHFGHSQDGELRVLFTDCSEADDLIKSIIEKAKNPGQFTVVSDDKGIKMYVRACGAEVMSVHQFAAELFSDKKKSVPVPSNSSKKYISLAVQESINKEMTKRWIK